MPSFVIPGGGPAEYVALMAALAAGDTVRGGKTVLSWREEVTAHGRRVTLFYAPPERAPGVAGGWDLRAWGTPPSEALEFTAEPGDQHVGIFGQ